MVIKCPTYNFVLFSIRQTLRCEADLDFSRHRFSEIKVQIKRPFNYLWKFRKTHLQYTCSCNRVQHCHQVCQFSRKPTLSFQRQIWRFPVDKKGFIRSLSIYLYTMDRQWCPRAEKTHWFKESFHGIFHLERPHTPYWSPLVFWNIH